ncbi:MAG: hypothetical protein Q4C59_12100 [Lachnospiraceae bacterium]|nr:hypothetical protein [Lachnospiraceae bacterium]
MRKGIVALLALLCLLLGGLFYWMHKQDDVNPPVISFPEEEILYEEGADTSILMEGVQAVDEMDGDVSDTLVIESIIPMQDKTSATVLYYAKDRSNNIAKATRIVEYMPEEGILWMVETEDEPVSETETEKLTEEEEPLPSGAPRITLTTNRVTIRQGESYNLLSYVKDIRDDVDGNDWLYGQIHIGGMHDISGPGTYELIYTVVDREGNMSNEAKLTLTIE